MRLITCPSPASSSRPRLTRRPAWGAGDDEICRSMLLGRFYPWHSRRNRIGNVGLCNSMEAKPMNIRELIIRKLGGHKPHQGFNLYIDQDGSTIELATKEEMIAALGGLPLPLEPKLYIINSQGLLLQADSLAGVIEKLGGVLLPKAG